MTHAEPIRLLALVSEIDIATALEELERETTAAWPGDDDASVLGRMIRSKVDLLRRAASRAPRGPD